MQNCPRHLAMQSCVLCSFVRCGTSKQIEKKKKKKWLRSGLKSNGWKVDKDGSVTSLWFTSAQLRKYVSSKRRGYNKKIICYDCDLEEGCPISEPHEK